ncbi:DUF4386 domain-containing protein [Micromonospora sp. NPDC002575]|uniref:DUF4386 domain-containing protein n=1 Tax=Micromonospora sp. NPDC002575 TaxID=3364222 RepID=UPI0036BF4741
MTAGTGATAEPSRAAGSPARRTALVAGVFYLITFLASLPAVALIDPVLSNPDYVVSAGSDTRVIAGCLLDIVNAAACVGTAVALFPVVRRQHEAAALGFVTARVLEAAIIVVGVASLLTVVTLRQEFATTAGADAPTLVAIGASLVAVRDWTFLLGPGLVPAANALLLGYLMYRSALVPRIIPLLGLVGAPLLVASAVATMFGLNEQDSPLSAVLTIPVAAWELSLGAWLVVKGFRPAPILARPTT